MLNWILNTASFQFPIGCWGRNLAQFLNMIISPTGFFPIFSNIASEWPHGMRSEQEDNKSFWLPNCKNYICHILLIRIEALGSVQTKGRGHYIRLDVSGHESPCSCLLCIVTHYFLNSSSGSHHLWVNPSQNQLEAIVCMLCKHRTSFGVWIFFIHNWFQKERGTKGCLLCYSWPESDQLW